jgi:hypothetical protein
MGLFVDLGSHGAQAVQAKDSAYKAAIDTKDAVSQKMSEAAGAASDAKDSAGQKASETYDAAADKAGQVCFCHGRMPMCSLLSMRLQVRFWDALHVWYCYTADVGCAAWSALCELSCAAVRLACVHCCTVQFLLT